MRYAAFLRGMNVGGHRLTNVELCGHVEALGFTNVSAFLASGNVLFDAPDAPPAQEATDVAGHIATGLRQALGYHVPTFLRSAGEVAAIACRDVFDAALVASRGKEQVVILARRPDGAERALVEALATDDDRLHFHEHELHWLPRAGLLDSTLDFRLIERTIGPTTTRTKNTIRRLAKRLYRDG